MFDFPSLYQIALMIPAIILGLTFHEYAHAYAADRLGDQTARYMGRMTVNPLPHIDPVGLILLLFAGFGWAKPVPINPLKFKGDMRRGIMLVSLAGPGANLLMAVASAILMGFSAHWRLPYLYDILKYMVHINLVLAVFNLIPVPPLDGSKILAGLLPGRQDWLYQMEQYGMIILILLIFTGAIGYIYSFVIRPLEIVLRNLAGVVSGMIY
ncbi:MAG: site-2 protease family protein [Eubacteriales bacterium]